MSYAVYTMRCSDSPFNFLGIMLIQTLLENIGWWVSPEMWTFSHCDQQRLMDALRFENTWAEGKVPGIDIFHAKWNNLAHTDTHTHPTRRSHIISKCVNDTRRLPIDRNNIFARRSVCIWHYAHIWWRLNQHSDGTILYLLTHHSHSCVCRFSIDCSPSYSFPTSYVINSITVFRIIRLCTLIYDTYRRTHTDTQPEYILLFICLHLICTLDADCVSMKLIWFFLFSQFSLFVFCHIMCSCCGSIWIPPAKRITMISGTYYASPDFVWGKAFIHSSSINNSNP